jgi:hypothetical protein
MGGGGVYHSFLLHLYTNFHKDEMDITNKCQKTFCSETKHFLVILSQGEKNMNKLELKR